MKKKIMLLPGSVTLLIILVALFLSSAPQPAYSLPPTDQASMVPVSGPVIPGEIFTGNYIRIGVNQGGTFGVGNISINPGTGFQYPIGPQGEGLAWAWWGEGYCISYRYYDPALGWMTKTVYWQPGWLWPPSAASGIVPVYTSVKRNDAYQAVYLAQVKTADGVLLITFTFEFAKDQMYVVLETNIKNTGIMGYVQSVIYKRFVDWDVHNNTGNNYWTSDATGAYAAYNDTAAKKYYVMSVSGLQGTIGAGGARESVSYVDIYGWDDYASRASGTVSIQSNGLLLYGDGAALLCYDLSDLSSGQTKTTYTVYQAGYHSYNYVP